MNLFGWEAWDLAQRLRGKAGRAEERWFLQKLHRTQELTELAAHIAERLHRLGKICSVQVQSVWIDALPQAVGEADGKRVKCELADLLYVVELHQPGVPVKERALLMQGKMAPTHNKLPLTGSTKVERALLERHTWRHPIELHRAHSISSNTLLGQYVLGKPEELGFEPFARYLLMARAKWWWHPERPLGPYVTGWPQSHETRYLQGRSNISLAECAVLMSENGVASPGHSIDATNSQWNALIYTLRSGNSTRQMKGYGGQPYVSNSEVVQAAPGSWRRYSDIVEQMILRWIPALRLAAVGWDEPFAWHQSREAGRPPPPTGASLEEDPEGFPLLPVITVIIKMSGEGESGSRTVKAKR